MDTFTPVSALSGGALIGLSAVILMAFNGRIAGITGILGGIMGGWLTAPPQDRHWRLAFLAGLTIAPLLYSVFLIAPVIINFSDAGPLSPWTLILGGLCVGFGTHLGGGCTSGHGICGNALFSARALIATLTFMATGIATVFIVRHVIGV